MKISSLFSFALLLMGAFAGISFTADLLASYNVDTTASTIAWKGYKVTGEHSGIVKVKSGSLDLDNGVLKGGSFVLDMTTIACTDGAGDRLAGHLKADDFFGVATYPTATFVIKRAISRGKPGEYKIIGDLTIKDTTKEIEFLTKLTEVGNQVTADATIQIDRTDYNVKYGSGSFFDGLGDKTIYDEFDLTVKLVANK